MGRLFRANFRPPIALAVLAVVLILVGLALVLWASTPAGRELNGASRWLFAGPEKPLGAPVVGLAGPETLPALPGYTVVRLPGDQLQNGWADAAAKNGWICSREPAPSQDVNCYVPDNRTGPIAFSAPAAAPPEKIFGLTTEELTLAVGVVSMVAGVVSGLGAIGWRVFHKSGAMTKQIDSSGADGPEAVGGTQQPANAVEAGITPEHSAPNQIPEEETARDPAPGKSSARDLESR